MTESTELVKKPEYDLQHTEIAQTQTSGPTSLLDMSALMTRAHQYRRNVPLAINNALAICCADKEAAEACFYSVPRAGKKITGASIGLAETLASQYGNLMISVDHIEERDSHIEIRGWIVDTETGLGTQDIIRRRITKKDGTRYNDDMITTAVNAARSILYRNLVHRVIPRPIVRRLLKAALDVAMGEGTTHGERQQSVVEFWEEKGINKDTLLRHIGRTRTTDITNEDMEYLIGVYQAIQGGEISIQDAFAKPQPNGASKETVKDFDELNKTLKTGSESPVSDDPEPEPDSPAKTKKKASASKKKPKPDPDDDSMECPACERILGPSAFDSPDGPCVECLAKSGELDLEQ